jgi:hypothetical protein
MPRSDEAVLWAIYRTSIGGKSPGVNVVCEQAEWDRLELAHPGQYTLVRSGIPSLFKAAYEKLTGHECGCADRQARRNRR